MRDRSNIHLRTEEGRTELEERGDEERAFAPESGGLPEGEEFTLRPRLTSEVKQKGRRRQPD